MLDLDDRGMPGTLSWTATSASGQRSGTVEVDPSGAWSVQAVVDEGDNELTLAIPGAEAAIDVVLHDAFPFDGPLQLTPDVAYVGEVREVQATISLGDPDIAVDAVRVVEVRDDGSTADVGTLVDDGDRAQGDRFPADAVYNGRFEVLATATGRRTYRVVVDQPGGQVARSEARDVLVAHHIDPTRFEAQVEAGRVYRERLDAARAARAAELAAIRDELVVDPSVAFVELSDGGLGFVYDNGVAAVLGAAEAGEKGSGAAPRDTPPLVRPSQPPARRGVLRAVAPEDRGGSGRVKAIGSQYWDWGEADDVPQMHDRLVDDGCFQVDGTFDDTALGGTVEAYKRLGDFGVVLVSTHGDSFFRGLDPLWADPWGWDGPLGQVVLFSNHLATTGNLPIYEDDLVSGRLLLGYDPYAMSPSFFRRYTGRMRNSLVYVSACRGSWNPTLATAFLDAGAGAFFGYSDYVDVSFTIDHGLPLLDQLLVPDTAVGEAFTPGSVEADSDPAEFRHFGSTALALDLHGLEDGSFEDGDLRVAWPGGGLGATSVTTLFDAAPTAGRRMAMVTSGIGDTNPATISQSFCTDPTVSSISVDWNLFTEDRRFCDRYDHFRMSVQGEGDDGPVYPTVLYVSFEDLVHSLVEVPGVRFTPECPDECVETSGWSTVIYTLPEELRGRRITVTFAVSRGGAGETAAPIDNVQLR